MITANPYSVGAQPVRPVIERGASWSYNETRILLSLWGQDMVQRQLTNSKRTRHVWEKIAERIREHGFDRTADQVRTRVFNMIAEYRRILKNPTPERKKKCIFFDALHKIYQAKDTNGVKAALNNYEEDYNLEPIEFSNTDDNNDGTGGDNCDENNSGTDNEDKSEVFAYTMSPSQALNGGVINGTNNIDNDDSVDGPLHINSEDGPAPLKRIRTDSNATLQQYGSQYQNVNSFDNSSSALLIDRMFTHLAKETEVMREWVNLERERLSQEVTRRKEESEREERREKCFLQTLMKMQEQMLGFLSKQQLQPISSSLLSSSHSTQHDEDLHHEQVVLTDTQPVE
ncbi:hypothetical protein B4U79_14852 [Dinothrombium tinctorium]|uniref:Myb/SANT-like DNA-binding domain-containing protein n=1 Tax=Dinothrombium tinctorium TaxID=1965070 RepID=A0A3S3PEP7_9ACAR|nr:hypothetical protein B4U79_15861 [Dinothrombium tinctorium]RWS13748.1 hypothetical protein B4U79_06319 [Dinothrombium tinctorium]RWS13891.1 hypothetical protein B4U79_14852 [Dinothrombium tinctorium]